MSKEIEIKDTGLANMFEKDEEEILEFTKKVRKDIVENYIDKKGLPTKDRDILAINNVLDSLDKAVVNKAELRLKQEEVNAENDIKEKIASIYKEIESILFIKKNETNLNVSNTKRKIPEIDYEPDDIVEGELDMGYKPISMEEVIGEEK